MSSRKVTSFPDGGHRTDNMVEGVQTVRSGYTLTSLLVWLGHVG
jgi:hypothetical protein